MLNRSEENFARFRAAFPEISEEKAASAHDNLRRYARLAVLIHEASRQVLTGPETGGNVAAGQVEPRPLKNTG